MDPDAHLICPGIGKRSVRYPFCVVWTPIPYLSWIIPVIGHAGICTSQGKVRDFSGSYFVGEDNIAFGVPTIYWYLNLDLVKNGISGWNYAVTEASLEYSGRITMLLHQYYTVRYISVQLNYTELDPVLTCILFLFFLKKHNLLCDNCHSHVAMALNLMEYDGCTNWNGIKLAYNIFSCGKYVTNTACMKTWLPFCSILVLILTTSLIIMTI